jgi:hypothetical protein
LSLRDQSPKGNEKEGRFREDFASLWFSPLALCDAIVTKVQSYYSKEKEGGGVELLNPNLNPSSLQT